MVLINFRIHQLWLV